MIQKCRKRMDNEKLTFRNINKTNKQSKNLIFNGLETHPYINCPLLLYLLGVILKLHYTKNFLQKLMFFFVLIMSWNLAKLILTNFLCCTNLNLLLLLIFSRLHDVHIYISHQTNNFKYILFLLTSFQTFIIYFLHGFNNNMNTYLIFRFLLQFVICFKIRTIFSKLFDFYVLHL